MSSNPQPQWAVLRQSGDNIFDQPEMAQSVLWMHIDDGNDDYRLYEIRQVVRDEIPVVTPQASSAERSDEDLIEAISRKLQQDFRLRIGPNTRRHITEGQESILLSLRECDDVARAAVAALKKVTL